MLSEFQPTLNEFQLMPRRETAIYTHAKYANMSSTLSEFQHMPSEFQLLLTMLSEFQPILNMLSMLTWHGFKLTWRNLCETRCDESPM